MIVSFCLARLFLFFSFATPITACWFFLDDLWTKIFWTIFVLRYTRLVGHVISTWFYRPAVISADPAFTRQDVSIILPTVDPNGPHFRDCLCSLLTHAPAAIFIVTVGQDLLEDCKRLARSLRDDAPNTRLAVSSVPVPNKRRQIAHAMPFIETPITILCDDHVFWPSENFIPSVLAPFENQRVGVVATKKRVRRTTPGTWTWESIINFLACNYLQRHNWELRSSNSMDGGVFVVSARTAVYRTDFLSQPDLLEHFCNEKFFFGLFGGGQGLNPDDDNFLTRNILKQGWLIKFQDTEDATMETSLGEWPKFKGQLLRWARTTFRSNPVMLRDPSFLCLYTWSAFMVYWAGILNFALLWDAALITSLALAKDTCTAEILLLLIWIFWTKVVKIIPHFVRHPSDFPLVICQIAFAYVHSIIKLWALLTFWDCDWSGRNLDQRNADNEQELRYLRPIFIEADDL